VFEFFHAPVCPGISKRIRVLREGLVHLRCDGTVEIYGYDADGIVYELSKEEQARRLRIIRCDLLKK